MADQIAELRKQVLLGEVEPEVANAQLDGLMAQAQQARKESFAKLPEPTYGGGR